MVFVEFEYEVAEETARVRALLEKLRIEATVVVFWLASGQLNTYELVINGQCDDIDWEIVVNEALRDEEWWDDLQMFRGRYDHMSVSQENMHLAHILDSTSGRSGIYNPHYESTSEHHRSGTLAELHRTTKSSLGKLGVHVGMHTQHLNDDIINDSSSDDGSSELGDESVSQDLGSPIEEDPDGEARQEFMETMRRPLLVQRGTAVRIDEPSRNSTPKPGRGQRARLTAADSSVPTYGTMSSSRTLSDQEQKQQPRVRSVPKLVDTGSSLRVHTKLESNEEEDDEDPTPLPSLTPGGSYVSAMQARRARSTSPTKKQLLQDPDATPTAPTSISRQSSTLRFSSRLVPEATITAEGDTSMIGFSNATPAPSRPSSPRPDRPMASRQSSFGQGRFSSRPVPEARLTDAGDGQRTITFAEQPRHQHQNQNHSPVHSRQQSRQQSRQHSRRNSILEQDHISPGISDPMPSQKAGDDETESAYSAQGIALSFNELPSRAQHLILNELMRQHSGDTAVLLSTLPVPSEGTSLDEGATIQYLSDVEVLCNELPPTLLVVSNNMTVTVSL